MEVELGTWLAICDGQKALLLENEGAWGFPRLKTRETFVQKNPPSHLQGTARPGKLSSGKDGRHAATEETDFHEQMATLFLRLFAQHINRRVKAHTIDALVLIAPAKALGILRPHLSPQASAIVKAELDKDYVKLPVADIERHLTGL
jgi:protein required for attachment to host cells